MLRTALAGLLLCAFSSCASGQTGYATWYDESSGTRTASGERFDENGSTCAMRTYSRREPQRTVKVTVVSTGRSATCRVNDFGPAEWTGNLIDVSLGVARKLGMVKAGRVRVVVE
jgi:rare lipoprotein A